MRSTGRSEWPPWRTFLARARRSPFGPWRRQCLVVRRRGTHRPAVQRFASHSMRTGAALGYLARGVAEVLRRGNKFRNSFICDALSTARSGSRVGSTRFVGRPDSWFPEASDVTRRRTPRNSDGIAVRNVLLVAAAVVASSTGATASLPPLAWLRPTQRRRRRRERSVCMLRRPSVMR